MGPAEITAAVTGMLKLVDIVLQLMQLDPSRVLTEEQRELLRSETASLSKRAEAL